MSDPKSIDPKDWEEFWKPNPVEVPVTLTIKDWAEREADTLIAQSGAEFSYLQRKVVVEAVRRGFAFRI